MTEPLTHRALIAPGFLEEEPDVGKEAVPNGDGAPAEETRERPPGEPTPPGLALADVLAKGLAGRGWAVEYRWTTYVGHALDARRGDHRYDVEVTSLDTADSAGAGRWLITAKRRTGFFKRLFNSDPALDEHALLRHDIDAALAADPRSRDAGAAWVAEERWQG